mmetsp:Transcript_32815/g.57223  ORF Transcript_32815/g.57223 Transcript_32815/m.57223 type:complete len:279 (-) Transcript_32815:7721-8557(-)
MIVLVLALVQGALAALKPANVVFAVNCGGEEHTSTTGIVYQKDHNFIGGVNSDFGKQLTPMKYTDTPTVYSTERYSTTDFSYRVPVASDGKYVLILKFSEVWFERENSKLFHIKVGNYYIASYLDIFAKVGKNAAYDEFLPFELKNGALYIDNEEVSGGYFDGFMQVDFIKTTYDNPKVNAIVLVKGTLKDTHYAEFTSHMIKIKEQKEKIQQDYYSQGTDVFEDELKVQAFEHTVKESDEEVTLLSVTLTPPGLAVVGSILLAVALLSTLSSKKKQD